MAGSDLEELLARFRKLPRPVRVIYARPRTFISFAAGILLFVLLPASLRPVSRVLIGWDGFALHYAHEYYRGNRPGGLQFPSGDTQDHADYWDFVYFSFVIGMTAQVSDVGITDKTIRRTATVHGIISFVFNTALLALMVNIAASAI